MKKTILFSISLLLLISSLKAQTLLTFGNNAVAKQEFLNAFYKNSNIEKPTENAFREYLELYIRYKLKVKAAYDRKLDKENNQVAELNDFRTQVIDAYMNDETAFRKLINEAVERSKKDIRVAHIYIPLNAETRDTTKAWKMAQDAYNELHRGTDFGNVAALFSSDTSVRSNKGDIGFITAFTLPYGMENIIYSLPPGKFSKPYRSDAGYHIFKNIEERNALGSVKAAQILFAFPPDANNAVKAEMKRQADSVYNALNAGASFNELAFKYNTDRVTATTNGEMQEFGVGRYDATFENAVFALSTPGQVSKPVLTSHGYHIIKLIERIPVDGEPHSGLYDRTKAKVEKDARLEVAKKELTRKILNTTGIKMAPVNQKLLFIYSDSILQKKKIPTLPGLTNNTVLFTLPKEKVPVSDWGNYLQDIREIPSLSQGKTMPELLQQYKETVATDYYRNHLEEYNPEFARQLKEFKEGNMLFEIMQRNIWDKANADTAGLLAYYTAHREKYNWGPSADVIMFSITDASVVSEFREKLGKNINDWKNIAAAYDGRVQADSGRYELNQLPGEQTATLKERNFTAPVTNTGEGTTSMMYVVKTYSEKSPRNFDDAKGLVLNDYQQLLEEKWIAELKQQYPVKVNEKVLQSLWQ